MKPLGNKYPKKILFFVIAVLILGITLLFLYTNNYLSPVQSSIYIAESPFTEKPSTPTRTKTPSTISKLKDQLFPLSTQSDSPRINNCQIFPADNPWNTEVSSQSVDPNSEKIIDRLSKTWGISVNAIKPYNVVDSSQPFVEIHYTKNGRTSDPGPMPIPQDAVYMQKTPGLNSLGNPKNLDDNHLMVVDTSNCKLYELWSIHGANADGSWDAGSGAIFDLNSNQARKPRSASSAASGLPVFAGLIRADEVEAGKINHALSMTTTYTSPGYFAPATNYQAPFGTGSDWDNPYNPAMGMRIRLKQDYDISRLSPQAQIIAIALKKYGAFITDGSPGSAQMAANPDPYLDIKDLATIKSIPASAFEVVETGPRLY